MGAQIPYKVHHGVTPNLMADPWHGTLVTLYIEHQIVGKGSRDLLGGVLVSYPVQENFAICKFRSWLSETSFLSSLVIPPTYPPVNRAF